ncbi:MAG: hypothetical protein FWF20_08030, partial [Betaproteobacteria bacterium]|nr:hypothetical protein [Betaproteobacteria bacterium]
MSAVKKTGELVYFLALLMISACSNRPPMPKYAEPDPNSIETARLRIVFHAGVVGNVTMHPGSSGHCLDYEKSVELPIHKNISGFFSEGEKKIGMPASNAYL